jgi:N6-adenosine-specific RNA methylase IME4/ParB-like chromosome segregation protein Spo0J
VSKYQLLPPLSDDDRAALEASIVAHGVLVPVEYDEDGAILDGHHRVEICESLGLVDWPRFVRKGLAETEKRTLARELNVSRRHLTAAQKRALVAGQLRDTPSISSRAIAAMLGVHHSTVEKVRKGLEETGEISQLETTEGRDGKERTRPKPIRTAFLPEAGNARELMATAKAIRDRAKEHGRKVRTDLINEIAARGRDAQASGAGEMPVAAYPILYADPPWQQEAWSDETGQDRGLMYPAMELEEIKALFSAPPLSSSPSATSLAGAPGCYPNDRHPATKDAVLFLWVTANRLDDGIDVLRAWGFDYVSCLVWDKVDIGMGRWVRDRHEILLIGKRGDFPAPIPGTQAASVFAERKGRHSAKPEFFAEMIDRIWPDLPKLELFARRARPGWDVWGFEASGDSREIGDADLSREGPSATPCEGRSRAAVDVSSRAASPAEPAGAPDGAAETSAGRRSAPAGATPEIGADRPSVSATELAEYKALGAIDAGVKVAGPVVEQLTEAGFVWAPGGDNQQLTVGGVSRLCELEFAVRAASDEDGAVNVRAAG